MNKNILTMSGQADVRDKMCVKMTLFRQDNKSLYLFLHSTFKRKKSSVIASEKQIAMLM